MDEYHPNLLPVKKQNEPPELSDNASSYASQHHLVPVTSMLTQSEVFALGDTYC